MLSEAGRLRFVLEGAEEGSLSDAEIGDYRSVHPSKLPWTPPLRLTVRSRASHSAGDLLGTAGFGFWNDPFDWSGNVQSPPNSLWFLYASPQSDIAFVPRVRGNGWKAASLNGGRANRLTMALGNFVFNLPGLSRLVYRLAETRMAAGELVLDSVILTDWHTYRIDWLDHEAIFFVDDEQVFRASDPPQVPLGFVAWIDNNCMTMGPGRDFSFKRLSIEGRQWLELGLVRIESLTIDRR
jgi:hypothetical protein